MIRLVFEEKIEENHRLLCPHCKKLIDFRSIIQITKIPGGLFLSSFLYSPLRKLENNLPILTAQALKHESFQPKNISEGELENKEEAKPIVTIG